MCNTLALKGADLELSEIMDHIGWTRRHTALYYLQLAYVLNPNEGYLNTTLPVILGLSCYLSADLSGGFLFPKLCFLLNCIGTCVLALGSQPKL